MPDGDLAHHVGEDVAQIAARHHRLEIRLVLLDRGREIEAVQVRVVEELALDPPRVVIHLLPLGARIRSHFDVVGVQRARARGRAAARPAGAGGRGGAASPPPGRAAGSRRRRHRPQRLNAPAIGPRGQRLLAVRRDLEEAHARCDDIGAPLPEIVAMHGQRRRSAPARAPGRSRGRFDREQRPRLARLELHVAARRQRHRENALVDLVPVDL